MKKPILIGVLLAIVAGSAMNMHAPLPQAPERAITDTIVAQIDSFSAQMANQLLPAAKNAKTDPEKLRQLFFNSRLAYKKFEWAAEYFTPTITISVNGPPAPETQLSGFVLQPTGLQVIESLLYPRYDPANRGAIVFQLRELITNCKLYRSYYRGATLLNGQVWDAAKQEVFRVMTLGIAGFDAPLAKSGLAESACSLRSVSQVLANYPAANGDGDLTIRFRKAFLYLEAGTDFDGFDRAKFITAYGNPLTSGINEAQQHLNLAPVYSRRLLRQNAATLFDAGAFDAWAYAAYPENGYAADKIALGQKLFNDPLLSGTGTRSCASCHQPEKAFTDGMVKNTELEDGLPLKRNTPTLLNAAFQPAQFDDLRVNTLEDQAHTVIESKPEMRGSINLIATRLSHNAHYSRLFAAAYPGSEKDGIGKKEITGAIAAYVRTLSILNSRFDAYMHGDPSAMDADELNGFNLFMGKAKCGTCHYMPLFNGALPPQYKKMDAEIIGVPATPNGARIDDDPGRYSITHATPDNHAFKTPGIRNAARTAPYMHNGVFATLEEVIDFYDKGGGAGMGIKIPNQTLSPEPLNLSVKEKKDLIAFIRCLDNK
jgi:cytochrome c peroxidase